MALQVSDIVRVSATIRPRGVLRRELGRTLFVTTDDNYLGAAGSRKVETYARFSDVAEVFGSDTEPYRAALIYFAQVPMPRNLLIGRWANNDSPTIIRGGAPASLTELQTISDGSFSINGGDITGVTFSSLNNLSEIAATVATSLASSNISSGVTVNYVAAPQRFVVSTNVYEVSGVFGPHSTSAGTDISGLLGLDEASGATLSQGGQAETIQECLDRISDLDDSFYFVTLESQYSDATESAEVSGWSGANGVMYSAESNNSVVTSTLDNDSNAARISALQSPRTFMTWSENPDYKSLSIAARFSSVNFTAPGSLITGKFKSLPGTDSDNLTASQKQELDRKNINHYSPYGGDDIYAEGQTFQNGVWIDVQYWIDWFTNAVQSDMYNLLRSSPKIAQTIPGIASMVNVVEGVCRQGVRNGGIAPGSVSAGFTADIAAASGDDSFNGFLSNGYIVVAGLLADQSQTEREARISPPINIYVKGSGAVHFAEIAIIFEN